MPARCVCWFSAGGGEDPAVWVLRSTCPSGDAYEGSWYNSLWFSLGGHCLADVQGEMISPCSLLPRVETSHPPLSRKPSQKSKQLTLSCPGFHQISAFTLSVSELSAYQSSQPSFVLSQACVWVSKLQILETPKLEAHTVPSREGCTLLLFARLSQKISQMTDLQFGVCGKVQEKACTKACHPQSVSLERPCHHSQMHSSRGTVSPHANALLYFISHADVSQNSRF